MNIQGGVSMYKKLAGLLTVLVLITGVFATVVIANGREKLVLDDQYVHELVVADVVRDRFNVTPSFVDPETDYEWVAIDQRTCEHDKWGLDLLFVPVDPDIMQDPIWICRGSLTMAEYIRNCDCCHNVCPESDDDIIRPFNSMECPRGCGFTVSTRTTTGPWSRVSQRNCTHFPWGVDIQNRRMITTELVCSSCRASTGTPQTRSEYAWFCYGFR